MVGDSRARHSAPAAAGLDKAGIAAGTHSTANAVRTTVLLRWQKHLSNRRIASHLSFHRMPTSKKGPRPAFRNLAILFRSPVKAYHRTILKKNVPPFRTFDEKLISDF